MGLLYDVPSQLSLDKSHKIKILVALPGIKDIDWDESASKQSYIDCGFVKQKVGITPECMQMIGSCMQAQRKQYDLKHCMTLTIHAVMGDTLNRVAIDVSRDDPSFKL
eukprot:6115793-Ditylum_brightwellii.AAC.1